MIWANIAAPQSLFRPYTNRAAGWTEKWIGLTMNLPKTK